MTDEEMARMLQEECDRDAAERLEHDAPNNHNDESAKSSQNYNKAPHLPQKFSTLSPVDPSFELSDPIPDIRQLFLQFNEEYFWGKLSGIEVRWSPRMTSCAGICVYEGHGGLCSVRLSQPLLKLRPRKDLVETLLHEMIHAYLFITKNDRDRDGHGPYFQNHMHRINKITGAKITIYHTFHDEVSSYQQHWWRCNGPCQHRRPYFGYVKRSMNRAPSANDLWWAEHRASCNGTYTKVKEPEDYGKKKATANKDQENKTGADIRKLMDNKQKYASSNQSKVKNDLFQTTGETYSSGKGRIGSLASMGKGHTTSSNSAPSSSKFIISGGILIPRVSSKHIPNGSSKNSPLFTPVGTSDTHIPPSTPESSQSVLSSKTNKISGFPVKGSQKQKNIIDAFDSAPKVEKFTTRNNKANISQVNGRQKGGNSVKFPPDFISVCTDNKKSKIKGNKKGKRRRYIFDELDEDDGLWDGIQVKNDISSSLSKNLSGNCKRPEQEPMSPNHQNVKSKRESLTDSSDFVMQASSSTAKPSSSKFNFPGKGHRLGSFTSTDYSRNSKSFNSDSFLSQVKKEEETIGKKRSFEKAFTSTIIDLSVLDSDEEEEAETVNQNRHSFIKKTKEEDDANNYAVGGVAVSESVAARSDDMNEVSENFVSCPVCSTKVFHESINAHLDMCL